MNRKIILLLVLLVFFISCKKPIKRSEIVGKVKELAALATLEIKFNKIVFAEKSKSLLFIHFNNAYYYQTIQPRIKTGIDLNKIAEKDIEIKSNRISIKLPPIEVLLFDYPADEGIVDNELSGSRFGNCIDIKEIELIHRATENDVRKQLNFMQIRERSEIRTRLLLEKYLRNYGFEQVIITFTDPPKYLLHFKKLTEQEKKDLNGY